MEAKKDTLIKVSDMRSINAILKRKKNWTTWEEKHQYLSSYFRKKFPVPLLDGPTPHPSVKREEIGFLKGIIHELEHDVDEVHNKVKDLMEAYNSVLEEIYQMPGCVDALLEMLECSPIGEYETYKIREQWYDQYDNGTRELEKNSSNRLPKKEINEKKKFLKSKCVEIEKAYAKIEQVSPPVYKVQCLLQTARITLAVVLKFRDNKDRSSSS